MLNDHITDEVLNGVPFHKAKELFALHLLGYQISYDLLTATRSLGLNFKQHHRKALTEDGNAMISVKFGFYRAMCFDGAKNFAHRKSYALANGLCEEDLDLFDQDKYPKLHKHVAQLKKKYAALSYEKYSRLLQRAISESVSNLSGFFQTKMVFLLNYGYEMQDLKAEVMARACRAALVHYPRYDNYEHFLNAYRRFSRQQGLIIINEHTKENANVFSEKGELLKFSLDYSTEDELLETGYLGNYSPDTSEGAVFLGQFFSDLTENQQRVMGLLTGVKSEFFERTLKQNDRLSYYRYVKGIRDSKIVLHILDYLSLPYSEYTALTNKALSFCPFKEPTMLRC